MNKRREAKAFLEAWAQQPRIAALTEAEKLHAAVNELGLTAVVCPTCNGGTCEACDLQGFVFDFNDSKTRS